VLQSDPSVLIMFSLLDGPKHGYALTKDIEHFAGTRLGPGTLYGALNRLHREGLIEALPVRGRQRPYRLTTVGATSLAEELEVMRRVVEAGLSRLFAKAG
jgi:DNA-binding PadR family transcriptional regulator